MCHSFKLSLREFSASQSEGERIYVWKDPESVQYTLKKKISWSSGEDNPDIGPESIGEERDIHCGVSADRNSESVQVKI